MLKVKYKNVLLKYIAFNLFHYKSRGGKNSISVENFIVFVVGGEDCLVLDNRSLAIL